MQQYALNQLDQLVQLTEEAAAEEEQKQGMQFT
jgi:hypothetical protein